MFEYVSTFDFTYEIFKRTTKIELNLNIEYGRAVLSIIRISRPEVFCKKGIFRNFAKLVLQLY